MTFTIEKRGKPDENGNQAQILIDDKGFVCGVFSSETEADEASPKIARNLAKGKVNMRYATLRYCRPNQQPNRFSQKRK